MIPKSNWCSSPPLQEGIWVRNTSPRSLLNCSFEQINFLQELFIALTLSVYSDESENKGSCEIRTHKKCNVLVFVAHWCQSQVGEIRPPWYFHHWFVGGPILLKGPSRGSNHVWSLIDFLTLLRRTGQINGDIVWLIFHQFSLQF